MINEMIKIIRDIALKGQMDDSMYGSDLICWQTSGLFLIVYAENLNNSDQYIYRIYKCKNKAEYSRKVVMNSKLENDDFKCVFNYEEGNDHMGLLFSIESGNWLKDFQNEISEQAEK